MNNRAGIYLSAAASCFCFDLNTSLTNPRDPLKTRVQKNKKMHTYNPSLFSVQKCIEIHQWAHNCMLKPPNKLVGYGGNDILLLPHNSLTHWKQQLTTTRLAAEYDISNVTISFFRPKMHQKIFGGRGAGGAYDAPLDSQVRGGASSI
jgi:hypothetical protein